MIIRNPKYKPLYTTNKRYIFITGGRGSGKSHELSTFLTLLTFEAGHGIFFTRYTLASASDSIIPELKTKFEGLECDGAFNILSDEVVNKHTDSFIKFRGLKTSSGEQSAKSKSLYGATTFVMDEMEEMNDEEMFDKIDLSIRDSKVQNRIIGAFNPSTKEHFIYKRFFEPYLSYIDVDGFQVETTTHPDVLHIHTTYLDNVRNLSPSFLARANELKKTNLDKYKHIMLGSWLNKAQGVIFENWTIGNFDESLPYAYGMDFGFFPDPTTIVKVAVDNGAKKLYVKELLYEQRLSSSSLIERVSSLCNNNDLIVADSSEPREILSLIDAGFNVQAAHKPAGSVISGIRKMQDYQIIVSEGSVNYIKELNNYIWNNKKASIPIDLHNHLIDATRYALDRLSFTSIW